jgi:hypothetical protein
MPSAPRSTYNWPGIYRRTNCTARKPQSRQCFNKADIEHAPFLAQLRNSFSSAHVPVIGHGQTVMPSPASGTSAQHLRRARYVPERTVNRGDPRPLTGGSEHHRPAKAQLSGIAPEAFQAGHADPNPVIRFASPYCRELRHPGTCCGSVAGMALAAVWVICWMRSMPPSSVSLSSRRTTISSF